MIAPASNLLDTIRLLPGYDPFATAGECWFDEDSAQLACDFFPELLQHVEGDAAGKPFILEPWEQAIIANLFGWKRKDAEGREVRRYRECLIYVPRKQGKTPLASGIGLYVFFCDEEAGQQDFIAASTREQAGHIFRHCKAMVLKQPALAKRCRIYGGTAPGGQSRSIVRERDGSFLRVIAADAGGQHGQNPHLILVDELHTQESRELIDTLRTGMGSLNRKQPLIVYITTADYERESICNEIYEHACRVRDGVYPDPSFLPCIWEAKLEDDWKDPAVWARANPNLGVSVSEEYLAREFRAAVEEPARLNELLRLHLNIITRARTRFIDPEAWRRSAGEVNLAELIGRECYGGLDLSSKYDLTAWVLTFPWEGGVYKVLPRFWIPSKAAKDAERKHGVPYSAWERGGYVTITPGASVDYSAVEAQIVADASTYQLQGVAYDPWNANATRSRLEEAGITTIEFTQSLKNYNEPTKEFQRLIGETLLHHGNHSVLTWNAENVEVYTDASGNIRPVKPEEGSFNKVDGIQAAVMGLSRAMLANPGNVYDTEEVKFL